MADWEELPQDILQFIARRLAIEDFLALRGVCVSWRSAAVKEMYSTKSKAPWLMCSTCNRAKSFSPSRVKFYRLPLYRFRPRFPSSAGWILMSKWFSDSDYFIFNPFSRLRIKLPTLEKMPCRPSKIDTIAFSSSPSLSRNYTVMVSISQDLQPQGFGLKPLGFALHRSGEDAWTLVSPSTNLPRPNVRGLVHYDGLFVVLDAHHQIWTLDEREHQMRLRLVLGQNLKGCVYLAECSGSLLVAWKVRATLYSFRIFKVDLHKGTEEEVKSLGNASLFLNDNSSFSVEFKAENSFPDVKPNCIYFRSSSDKGLFLYRGMYVYSLEQGKVERYSTAPCEDYYCSLNWFQAGF